jgi:Tfp pilus assembly protein PilF
MTSRLFLLAAAGLTLAGCAGLQPAPTPAAAPAVSDLLLRPAERALAAGMRAYDDAQYPQAERELKAALAAGLAHTKDQAAAHKLLAFIYCTSQRSADCEAAFRAARAADAGFALSRAEAGHPQWGPVYRRVSASR